MKPAPITATVEGGDFQPIISKEAMDYLAAACKRWVDAGKPDYIPAEENA